MSALRKAQFEYDNRQPPPVSDENPAEAEWLGTNAERLTLGYRIEWGYRKADRGEVTQAHYWQALQDLANQRQKDGRDQIDAFGELLALAGNFGSSGRMFDLQVYLLGSKTARKEVALELLRPHAAKAIALQAEQDELEREAGW
ncbi:hypothetical protein SAMN04489802_2804 [Pseudomonas chlororaphis]|uniref:hypothetical protein n=1 Tax=Pseudomonas chlororaphis TaxID=587753 RepID=UPI00087C564F|nr:hypothetical protein [Pseudomonas chlororaphis]AZD67608.1 hypothetical protein C4K17_3722 [Pseudomonas chlororaphis subsp. aurantiaca]QIT23579.1 hypothetical protein HCN09_18215 [Pseudomonas chlororaphis subsp. aurantiaca]WDH01673.1 hypothetical protein PUP57_19340 [Pseudomonas chlororaphis]WDH09479.1 hypothetical protein PUP64_27670 [Pseudomonas chlororaphis]SDS97418.1 hypothetical protein SAMN04489802_2804 [Pseudomonas chlororaphis]